MSEYRKTIAAAVGAVITILSAAGVGDVVDPLIQTAIVTLLTVVAVYLVPNLPTEVVSVFELDRRVEGSE